MEKEAEEVGVEAGWVAVADTSMVVEEVTSTDLEANREVRNREDKEEWGRWTRRKRLVQCE